MDCCQCKGIETLFNEKEAKKKLRAYRKDGPAKTTRILIEALKGLAHGHGEGIVGKGMTLLDIGGGVGATQHELMRAGIVERATGVDASGAYLKAAFEEAERQGHADRVSYHHANFVDLAPQVQPVDIVTLDRVICCYHDMEALVRLSVAKAGKLYGLVYPRDTWWMRAANVVVNLCLRAIRNPFRTYITSTMGHLLHIRAARTRPQILNVTYITWLVTIQLLIGEQVCARANNVLKPYCAS